MCGIYRYITAYKLETKQKWQKPNRKWENDKKEKNYSDTGIYQGNTSIAVGIQLSALFSIRLLHRGRRELYSPKERDAAAAVMTRIGGQQIYVYKYME